MPVNEYDLIIIGAGVLGSFHAYHALNKGHSVLQMEKDNQPRSATVRNFGQIVPSGMKASWFEFSRRSLDIYSQIQKQYDLSIRQNGSVYIASDEEEQQILHELKASFDDRDYNNHLLSKQQCLEKWPALQSSYVKEGLFFPEEVSVDPLIMIHNLIAFMKAKFDRYTYLSSTPISQLEHGQNQVKVYCPNGDTFLGKKILICSGAEFNLLFPELFRESQLEVSKLQMLRTRAQPHVNLKGNILTGLTIRRYESFTECPSFLKLSLPPHYKELKKWGIHILFKQADDGSIILGDSHEYASAADKDSLNYEINHHINELITREAERIVNMKLDKLASSWIGFYSQHPDDIYSKKIGDNVYVLTGIGGKGMTSSAGYAEQNLPFILES